MIYIFSTPEPIVAYETSEYRVFSSEQYEKANRAEPNEVDALNTVKAIREKSVEISSSPLAQPQPFSLTQLPETPPLEQRSSPAGRPPSLQIQPSSPEEKPFQPQRVPLQQLRQTERGYRSSPSVNIITPSGYGKTLGSASVGASLQARSRFTNSADAVLGLGIGLGNPQQLVGLDVDLTVTNTDDPFNGNTLGFKLHRRLTDEFAVAVGIKNAARFGINDSGTSAYGVATKMFRLQDNVDLPFSRLYVSFGLGGGQFRSQADVVNKIDSVGVFGSAAVRVARPVNAIAEWTGQDLTLGLSFTPFRDIPLVITPAVTDITGNAGDGSRFILGIGYGASF